MTTRKLLLVLIINFTFVANLFAQRNVNVNPLTGTANVAIPIYTIHRGQVVFPIGISYVTSGVRPTDIESSAGMGWTLQAGGQVSRQVRGLPDDIVPNPDLSVNLYGWMSPLDTAANNIGFTIHNNGSNCSYENADVNYINTHFPYQDDTEPDMFYVNAPGLSCQMVYNRADTTFHPVTYQDLVIKYTKNPSTGFIQTFTITNDKGITYVFGRPEPAQQTTYGGSQVFFKTQYNQYKSPVNYNLNWNLTTVTDANGNGVVLNYNTAPLRASTDSIALYIGGSSTATVQYYIAQKIQPYTLSNIQTTDGDIVSNLLKFNWFNTLYSGGGTGQNLISSIAFPGRYAKFTYNQEGYTKSNGDVYYRQFLGNYTDDSTAYNSPVKYTFNYYGDIITHEGNASFYSTTLPDSASKQVDYWGYYAANSNTTIMPKVWCAPYNSTYHPYMIYQQASEGSYAFALPGNTMMADTVHVMTGSLNKITYANGENSNIIYESNDYYDPITATNVKGNGIRVRQVIDSVGNMSTNNIIRNYNYNNPTTHKSSGRPISLPSFAFVIPYSGSATGITLWENSTVLSKIDLSNDDHTIMYEYSKESMTGAGYTLSHYYVPASNWDNSANPVCSGCTTADWHPALNYAARTNCSLNYGQIVNSIYSYPFVPNKNYDFERGLPLSAISYTDAGVKVSETDYAYQRAYSPDSLIAFKSDDNINGTLNVKSYNKYTIYYHTGELTDTVKKTVYDSNGSGTSLTTVTAYGYNSAYHKLVTQQSTINSDGNTFITKMSYAKDFPLSGPDTNAYRNGLYYLQQRNINAPVEQYQEVTQAGTTAVTGASLTFYKENFSLGGATALPAQQQSMVESSGIPATGAGAFTPFSAGIHLPVYDSRYLPTANFTSYDESGYLATADDAHHHIKTQLIDHITYQPVAVVSNAQAKEFAFQDFDSSFTTTTYGLFTISGSGAFTPNGSHTGKAYGFANTQTATSTSVSKNAIAQNYILSMWINAPASTTGTIGVALNGGTPVNYADTTKGVWQYHEWLIPVGTMPSAFTVSFTSGNNISIDDILFYPDVAEVTTAAYNDTTFFKTAQTTTNGVSTYFTNDQWGRNMFTYDQDHNILKKNTYVTGGELSDFNSLTPLLLATNITGTMQVTKPVTFNTPPSIIDNPSGATINWNYGDGSSSGNIPVTATATHTYTTTGTKTVTASIVSPYLGRNSVSTPITIIPVPASPINLTYTNSTNNSAAINYVQFAPTGGGTTIQISGANLNNAQIPAGTYNVTVSLYGSYPYPYPIGSNGGYSCLKISSSCWSVCSNYVKANSYTYSNVNLTSCGTVNFKISTLDCSHVN